MPKITDERRRELWETALADANYVPGDDAPVLFVASTASADEGQLNEYLAPGWSASGSLVPLTTEESAALADASGQHRVIIAEDADEAQTLGGMAWSLAAARQHAAAPDAAALVAAVHDVLSLRFRDIGEGSALLIHLTSPYVEANAAAAALVTKTLGPQVGRLHGTWGVLFREHSPQPPAGLAERLVALGALFPEDLRRYAGHDRTLRVLLSDLDERASAWWDALVGDELLTHFRALIPAYTPTPEEVSVTEPSVEAWRPLAEHLRRGVIRGLEVIRAPEPS